MFWEQCKPNKYFLKSHSNHKNVQKKFWGQFFKNIKKLIVYFNNF